MRKAWLQGAATVIIGALGLAAAVGLSAAPATGTNTDDHKVTICHSVNGEGNTGNGYNLITVDKDSIVNKEGVLNGHGLHEDDIIPAFAAGSQGSKEWGSFPGRGDASWISNNCAAPDETTEPDPTEPDPTEPDPTEPDPTEPDPTTPDPTTPDPTTPDPTEPDVTIPDPGPRCPPGMEPTAGKDGEPGNDECEFPEEPVQPEAPVVEEPPVVEAPPTVTPPVVTPPTVKPKAPAKQKAKAPAKKAPAKKVTKKVVLKNGASCKTGGEAGAIYKGKCHAIVRGSG